jgi:hypothetical protein
MKHKKPEKILEYLQQNPPFEELCTEFPQEWVSVQQDLQKIYSEGNAVDLQSYLSRLSKPGALTVSDFQRGHADGNGAEAKLSQVIRFRLAHYAVKRHNISAATGIDKGKVRFNLLNGYVSQKLLFSEGLQRKPVSMFWFNLLWPLIWQKKFLMPLVQPEGIYCFYSRQLIVELAGMIGSRKCIEIAAGDGTLTRFLAGEGVQITATDDHSWGHAVKYPESVICRDAKEALNIYAPEVVLCSWPPANNKFEKQVFRTKSVQMYVVIGSRHQFAAGNWSDYKSQTTFAMEEESRLSRLVLPPELNSAVYIFRRNP